MGFTQSQVLFYNINNAYITSITIPDDDATSYFCIRSNSYILFLHFFLLCFILLIWLDFAYKYNVKMFVLRHLAAVIPALCSTIIQLGYKMFVLLLAFNHVYLIEKYANTNLFNLLFNGISSLNVLEMDKTLRIT